MTDAFLWGLLATSSLIIGGSIAINIKINNKLLGVIMAFGAGTLISAVSYELIYEAVRMGKGTGYPAMGLFAGAFTFFLSDRLIEKIGGKNHKSHNPSNASNLVVPMVLAIILDGIPESIVIGLSIKEGGSVSMAMLVAVFISNMPESIAGTIGLRAAGKSRLQVFFLWLTIAIVCALSSVIGFEVFSNASTQWLSFIQAFAGGAILVMLANSMIPESYEHGGKWAGIATVLGFAVAVSVVVLEMSQH
jgi:zinc transporter, ZIP family